MYRLWSELIPKCIHYKPLCSLHQINIWGKTEISLCINVGNFRAKESAIERKNYYSSDSVLVRSIALWWGQSNAYSKISRALDDCGNKCSVSQDLIDLSVCGCKWRQVTKFVFSSENIIGRWRAAEEKVCGLSCDERVGKNIAFWLFLLLKT